MSNDDNLLPLVNIIFLLLIFFMLAGVIAKQKELYDVDLATAVIDEYADEETSIIFIKSDSTIIFNDTAITSQSLDDELKTFKERLVYLIIFP